MKPQSVKRSPQRTDLRCHLHGWPGRPSRPQSYSARFGAPRKAIDTHKPASQSLTDSSAVENRAKRGPSAECLRNAQRRFGGNITPSENLFSAKTRRRWKKPAERPASESCPGIAPHSERLNGLRTFFARRWLSIKRVPVVAHHPPNKSGCRCSRLLDNYDSQ
jgi:hypothetical protein